jgi:hypothetical protein
MKKILILVTALFSLTIFAQVGIGTTSPASSSILDLTATNKALLLTRVANTAAIASPVNGMMIYDISANCVKGYENGAWTGCISSAGGVTPPIIGTERTPCSGLENPRDFNFSTNSNIHFNIPMFISGDGYIYGGWNRDEFFSTGLGQAYTGDMPTNYNYSSNRLHSAYPAANILKYLPNERWNRIGARASNQFAITESGKMYVWGATVNLVNTPITGTLSTFTNRSQAEIPREIINPDGNQWKHFFNTDQFMYAVDNTGKWWSWGGLTQAGGYNVIAFASNTPPPASAPFSLTPIAASALVPAPKYNSTINETFAVRQSLNSSFVYIGTDNKVYTYGGNEGVSSGPNITVPQLITLPAGVNPVKVLSNFILSNFLILGDNGLVYRVGNGGGNIPATGFNAVALNISTYTFKDIIIGHNGQSIHGVPMDGSNMVQLSYSWTGGVGITGPHAPTTYFTSRFNIVKLWRDSENIIFKDGNTGNVYAYTNFSQFTSPTWVSLAVGFEMNTGGIDPDGNNLSTKGPYKLINCLK